MHIFFYLTLMVVVVFLLLQLYVQLQGFLKRGKKLNGLPEDFGRELQKYTKTLIYFYTPTCSACKVMTPVIDRLKGEFDNILKIDINQDSTIGRLFGVMGTPSMVLVENFTIQNFVVGARKEPSIRKLLNS